MTLVPLYDLTQQFNNKNGAVLVGGRLYVYYVGRTELATTWADEDAAAQNTNPVLLDNNGRAPVFVDDSYSYTLVVCDRAGTELFSQDITPGGAGSVGGRIVYHDETLSGTGTVSSLLGVVNIPLGVDETMTAYTGVSEGKDALILGVNGDWFNKTFSGEFDQKVDLETFSACCSSVKEGLDNKLDASAINNYYTKNEVDERTSSFVNYNFLSSNYYNKFETSSREELYSAFLSAGQGGNPFPMTGINGTTGFTANMDCSSMYISTGLNTQGSVVKFNTKGVHYAAYPSTDVSASWYDIITQLNNITCSSVKLTTSYREKRFVTSSLPNLNKITFIAPSYGPYGTYSALIDDGENTFVAEVASGCCMTVVKCWNEDRNKDCWCGLNQENYFYIG